MPEAEGDLPEVTQVLIPWFQVLGAREDPEATVEDEEEGEDDEEVEEATEEELLPREEEQAQEPEERPRTGSGIGETWCPKTPKQGLGR